MCLISAMFQVLPDCPLLLLANRDESYNRPSSPPTRSDADGTSAAWLAGRDQRAGGTWPGLNESGIIVAITNRKKRDVLAQPPSRGLLCVDLLGCRSVEEANETAIKRLSGEHFAGCNVLVFSVEQATVIEAGDEFRTHHLSPGVHTIANARLDDGGNPRVVRARSEVARRIRWNDSLDGKVMAAQAICALTGNESEPALCIKGSDRGTVSSTVIALADDTNETAYFYAPGPPSDTPYDDYSSTARDLLRRRHVER